MSKQLETSLNNLPIQLSSFIGRERAIADLKHLLPTTRLLTLTGAGGSGKTRLALQVATDLLPAFEHGVWWVELASLTDPVLVPQQSPRLLASLSSRVACCWTHSRTSSSRRNFCWYWTIANIW